MLQNLHTHTNFSDGSENPERYAESAISLGLTSIGFSDHSPLPFENSFALREERVQEYCDSIVGLKEANSGLEIFLGMEVDYIPGMGHSLTYFRDHFPVDYLIGSVHLVRNGPGKKLWFIDGPDPATYDQGLREVFGGDIRKGVTAYYRQIIEMLESGRMEIIGHLDKIKMHNRNRFFLETDPWYSDLVDETLEAVRRAGAVVEVNTRGIYKKRTDSLFPGPAILKKIHALGIPVTICSDAHKPSELCMLFDETAGILKETGFRELMCLTAEGWKSISLQ